MFKMAAHKSHYKTDAALGALAMLFLGFGILTTPERLVELGPLRESLCSDLPGVSSIAHLEVRVFRIACFVFSLLFITFIVQWERILASSWVRRIQAHEVKISSACGEVIKQFNLSSVVLFLFLTALGVFVWLDPSLVSALSREDSLFAWATVGFLCIGAAGFASVSLTSAAPKAYVIMYRLFAVVFLVMAGEEISWGQRIFNIATPDLLAKINVQNEINLHNLFGYFADHIFIAAVFAYGVVCPVLAKRNLFARKLFDRAGIPLPTLGLAAGFLALSMTHPWTLYWFIPANIVPEFFAEIREMLTSAALSLVAYEAWLVSKRIAVRQEG